MADLCILVFNWSREKIFPLKILYQLESIFPGMIFIKIFVLIFGSLIFVFNPMNL